MVHRIRGIMGIWIAFGLVVLAVGAAVLLRVISDAVARVRRGWSLRKMRFCSECGVLLGDRETCPHCHGEGSKPAPAGRDPSSAN